MTAADILNSIGGTYGGVDWLTGETIIEAATLEQNINGDGGLSLSWKSDVPTVIPAGTTFGDYVMMETYVPSLSSNGIYQHSPKFSDPAALLGRMLYSKSIEMTDGSSETLYTFPYTGPASTLLADFGTFLGGLGWSLDSNVGGSVTISVSFDGDTIKSAAQKIADACGANIYYVGKTIHIGTSSAYAADTYYNRFVVLGGTRNMGKKVPKGGYAAITRRLTINDSGSVIDLSDGKPPMTKMLIFDDIYPKMELVITSVARRPCWLLDENGEKIPDGNGGYKQYGKWYITLGLPAASGNVEEADEYEFNPNILIQGKPLGILFQSGSLTGREFELTYFDSNTHEKMEDDANPAGFDAVAGMYRINIEADGDTILPGFDTLTPNVGDLVTLTNVALDGAYYTAARTKLEAEGRKLANIIASGKTPSYQAERRWPDFMDGASNPPELGDSAAVVGDESTNGYIVTSVTTDLITGAQTITYGTFTPKGLISTLVDKVDGVTVSGGGGTTASDNDYRGTSPMTSEQWHALASAGGRLGMKTVNTRISEFQNSVTDFGSDLNAVKDQADKKMEIYFAEFVPHPLSEFDSAAPTLPNSAWTTEDDKALHVGDILYNTSREAANQYGGMAWRWMAHEIEDNTIYWWDEITDADTLLALEKAADVAYDGRLAGGTEKVRLYTEWLRVVDERAKFAALFNSSDSNWQNYNLAYVMLARMLNGGTLTTPSGTPAWINGSNLDVTTTVLFSADFFEYLSENSIVPETDYSVDIERASREVYRIVWQQYYEKASDLDGLCKQKAVTANTKVVALASDNVLSGGTEKRQIRNEWLSARAQYYNLDEQAGDYVVEQTAVQVVVDALNQMKTAWNALWKTMGESSDYSQEAGTVRYPSYIDDSHIDSDTVLSSTQATDYRNAWVNWYKTVSALSNVISEAQADSIALAKSTANDAASRVEEIIADGLLTIAEKEDMREEYVAAFNRMERETGLRDRAQDSNGQWYENDDTTYDPETAYGNWKTAFNVLSRYLNNQSSYGSSNTDWHHNLMQATFSASPPVELSIGHNGLPSMINGTLSETEISAPDTFRALWRNVLDAEVAMETAVDKVTRQAADVAQATASSAQDAADSVSGRVDNIESDAIISKGGEKTQLYVRWKETVAEFWRNMSLAEAYGMELTPDTTSGGQTVLSPYRQYLKCYCRVLWMLNNSVSEPDISTLLDANGKVVTNNDLLNGNTVPFFLTPARLNTDDTIPTSIGASGYRSRWSDYASAKETLLRLAETAAKDAAEAAATAAAQSIADMRQQLSDDTLSLDELATIRQEFLSAIRDVFSQTGWYNNTLNDSGVSAIKGQVLTWLISLNSYALWLDNSNNNPEWDLRLFLTFTLNGVDTTVTQSDIDNNPLVFPNGTVTINEQSLLAGLPVFLSSQTTSPVTVSTQDAISQDHYDDLLEDFYDKRRIVEQAYSAYIMNLIRAAIATANSAQQTATATRQDIDKVVADSWLSVDEKPEVLKEWLALAETYNQNIAIATRLGYTGETMVGESELWRYYLEALNALGQYLNGDNETGSESEWNYSLVISGVSSLANLSGLNSSHIPLWIKKPEGYNGGKYSEPTYIDRDVYRSTWVSYYKAEKIFVDDLNAYIKHLADTANGRLDDIASDAVITPFEKNDLLSQWKAWAGEYQNMLVCAERADVRGGAEFEAYQVGMRNLANFLDNPSTYSTDSKGSQEVWISNGEFTLPSGTLTIADYVPTMLTTGVSTALSEGQKTQYGQVLLDFRKARTALLSAFSSKMSLYVSETPPEDSFNVGDRWLWKNHLGDGTEESGTDTMMYCVKAYDSNYQPDSGVSGYNLFEYWKPYAEVFAEIEPDPRFLLASLGDRLFTLYGEMTTAWPIEVSLDTTSTVTLDSGTYSPDDEVTGVLSQLYDMLGQLTFHVRRVKPATGNVKYDIVCTPVGCDIPGSQETVMGGVRIEMWNGTRWEYIQLPTSSLLENLGNKILAVVFGSNAAATEAAGLSIGQRFARLFASAQVYDESSSSYVSLAEAMFGLFVEPYRYVNVSNGTDIISKAAYDALSSSQKANYTVYDYRSVAQLSADNIDFSGKTVNINASERLTFTGSGTGGNQGTIDFTGAKIAMNAKQLQFSTDDMKNLSYSFGLVMMQNGSNGEISLGTFNQNKQFIAGLSFRKVTVDGDTYYKLNLDASEISLNAEQINFVGQTVINGKFMVDQNGNVTLNDLTVTGNSTFQGTVEGITTGIIKARDLYRALAVLHSSGALYYYDSEHGGGAGCWYIISSEDPNYYAGSYVVQEEEPIGGQAPNDRQYEVVRQVCTGSADIVVAADYDGTNWPDGNVIRLPMCSDFPGKLVEVRNNTNGNGNAVVMQVDEDGAAFYTSAGSTQTSGSITIAARNSALFFSTGSKWIRI